MKKYLLLVVLFVLGFAVVALAAWDGATNYPAALEFGTMEFGGAYDDFTYPVSPVKKKNMSRSQAEGYPRGMNPFAPIRRVLYNDAKMAQIIEKAVK